MPRCRRADTALHSLTQVVQQQSVPKDEPVRFPLSKIGTRQIGHQLHQNHTEVSQSTVAVYKQGGLYLAVNYEGGLSQQKDVQTGW